MKTKKQELTHAEKVERLKRLYSADEVSETIGFFDESALDVCSILEPLKDTEAFTVMVYELGAENGNFEEAINLNQILPL
jgi:hypothetical protein